MAKKVTRSKRPGRSKPWEARWRTPDGKPKSKFFRTRELRDALADELDRKLENDGLAILSVDMEEIRAFQQLKEQLGAGENILDLLRSALRQKQMDSGVTLRSVFDSFLSARRVSGVSDDYLRHLETAFNRFEEYFPNRTIASISVDEVTAWLIELPFEEETKLNQRKHLHAAFEFAHTRRWIPDNTIAFVPKPKVVRPEPGVYTVAEVQALLSATQEKDPPLLVPFCLGLFGGLRTSETLKLNVDQVCREELRIDIPAADSKNGRRRIIEHLPENLWRWLEVAPMEGFRIPKREFEERRKELRQSRHGGVAHKNNAMWVASD